MPRAQTDLEPFRSEIERRILQVKQPQKEIIAWLATQGVSVSDKTLIRRCRLWGASRRITIDMSNPELIEAIRLQWSTTTDNDEEISKSMNTKGFPTTARHVKEARLNKGWRRRAATKEQMAEQRRKTFDQVKKALEDSEIGPGGRKKIIDNLRTKNQYRACEKDIRDALRELDPQGTAARKPHKGLKRTLQELCNTFEGLEETLRNREFKTDELGVVHQLTKHIETCKAAIGEIEVQRSPRRQGAERNSYPSDPQYRPYSSNHGPNTSSHQRGQIHGAIDPSLWPGSQYS